MNNRTKTIQTNRLIFVQLGTVLDCTNGVESGKISKK